MPPRRREEAPAEPEVQVEVGEVEVSSEPVEEVSEPQYVVTAPLVQAAVADRVLHFHKGAILPGGVSKSSVEHLLSIGFVAQV
jgi:hypothetical protein